MGNASIEQPASKHGAVHRAFHRAAADNQRYGLGKRVGDRPRERIAPAGDEGDVNSRSNGFRYGGAIRVRQVPAAVEQRAVHVYTDQPNHAIDATMMPFISRFYA